MSVETLLANQQFVGALLIGFGALLALLSILIGAATRTSVVIAAPQQGQQSVPAQTPSPVPQPAPTPVVPVVVPEPAPAPPPPVLTIRGKISTFGGPLDHGSGDPDEGLALYEESQAAARPDLFLSVGDGLFRRLNPAEFYVAARWDYKVTSKSWLRGHKVKITANGKTIDASPVDWGPHVNTGRALDISPGAAQALGLRTDDVATAEVPLQTSVALPQDRPGGASWLARAVALRGLYERQGDADNPAILEMARICGGQIAKTYTHDEIAWCALFVNYSLVASKYPGNDSLWALDFGKYGRRLAGPAIGAIASKKRDGGGHVFLVLGQYKGKLVGIGGNQSDMVCDDVFNPSEIVAYTWPEDAPIPVNVGISMTDLSALPEVMPVPREKRDVGL